MGKAVRNFEFNDKRITEYLLPIIELEDENNIFKKDFESWNNLVILLIEALKIYSEIGKKFDFSAMFNDLTGKIPYTGRRKKLEKNGGILIFTLFQEAIVDHIFNLKIDPNRRKIILQTNKRFKSDAIKMLKKVME